MWFWVDVENYGVDEIRKRIVVLRELFLRHYNRKTTTPLMKETLQNMIFPYIYYILVLQIV
jgi:hypothetical protein